MTTEYIYNKVGPVVQHLLEHKLRLVAIVTDNEASMIAATRKIRNIYGLVDIPCAAHTIQLIVYDMFKIDFIKTFNKHIDTLFQYYTSDKSMKKVFYNNNTRQLRKPNTTRWNS